MQFGFLKYLIVTPQYHHWHHSDNPSAYDKNFAIHFPFIDFLFGTYHLPGDQWPDPGPSPEQCSLENDQRRAIIDCLQTLQMDRRRPILMAFYQGFTYEQIAETLAIPLGTIKSRVRSGLKGLQECLRL